jgi:hypothetical protein
MGIFTPVNDLHALHDILHGNELVSSLQGSIFVRGHARNPAMWFFRALQIPSSKALAFVMKHFSE